MTGSNYDVLVAGAGAAGLTAAIGLAQAGFTVAAIEAAPYPGAENWSGCVYFCENLAHPDILGPEGVEALAWERRLVERGFFACDGYSLLGMKYRDPGAFRHCYTVLRPIFDHHLAQVALRLGVALLNSTTAESLIRENGRVVGVCTNRGPLYADLVFLAEGDASHLVTREGYERFTDQREAPKFLQGIKQVIDLPAGAIEERFGVGPEEGAAYEMLLRNGTLRGCSVHLNMGGFVYTNRQSLSVGLVLPADNLREHFDGDPNLLLEWLENLPALRPWLEGGKRGVFGAKLIRGGGAKDIPNLVDEGLAIGGAASAVGVDFPYPNFTGPATAMGLLLTQAACRIRAEGGHFSRDNLRRHYLAPLQHTHYWKDVEFLRSWPGYVKRTQVFFGRNLDLALGTAYVWTRPRRWFLTKWTNWLRLVLQVAGPGDWREMRTDLRYLVRALRMREVVSRPALGQLILDGTINALRDLARSPRANLPAAGTVRLHYSVAGGLEPAGLPPAPLQRWFQRLAPILAGAARTVYANDETPLATKLPAASQLLTRQVNMLDLLACAGVALGAGLTAGFQAGWDRFLKLFRRTGKAPKGLYPRYAQAAHKTTDLTPVVAPAGQHWETRLGQLAYETVKASHIHVLWPKLLQNKNAVVKAGLWHVCPARVYEARVSPLGQLQIVVNYENCIKCETCWRTSDLVDWARDGQHQFVYPVTSPVIARLLDAVQAAGPVRPALPHTRDRWEAAAQALAERFEIDQPRPLDGQDTGEISELYSLIDKLDGKLQEFDTALAKEPRTINRERAEYLEMLARYAQQLALRVMELLRDSVLANHTHTGVLAARQQLSELATALLAKAEERARRTWDRHFAWAAADGRQLRMNHLAGLRRLLDVVGKFFQGPAPEADPARLWLRAEDHAAALADYTARLDAVLPPSAWREIDRGAALTSAQDAALRDLIAQVPPLNTADLGHTLHPPLRKALLSELGRRDPSLAYRVACHLWARDLARLRPGATALSQAAERWVRGDEWACFAAIDARQTPEGGWAGEALFVPAAGARALLLLLGDQLAIVPAGTSGLYVEPVATLGLRGAGVARVRVEDFRPPETRVAGDAERVWRVWQVLSSADLTSIAFGMADQLCRRAIAHATSRVQFPGLFHDEQARDPIGKFGAVKKMIAEMAARRYLIETLDQALSPADFSSPSTERAQLVKALVAEALGTAPGSLSYNAGQIFGGTGYSEDDILSKFYRDAAAWRYLGSPNMEIYGLHGDQLLRNWQPDGRRLAALDHEAQLFDQVAQRKALQGELDEVRVLRSRLRGLVNEWQAARRERLAAAREAPARGQPIDPAGAAEVAELLGRQDAQLLASKALLLRTHARLEHSLDAEAETALMRVWLEEASVSVEAFESTLRRWLDAGGRHDDRPLVDPGAGPLVSRYEDYLAAPCPYDSGDFLVKPTDLAQPRFVPEMIEADPVLAERDRELRGLLSAQFGGPRDGAGLPYERYIERQHRPDPEDLDFCRRHGFFRMPIAKNLGGEGRLKVDYYLLTTNAQRLADVAVSLTIQANTSIGTTPILLARDKDLPRAQKDLGPFVGDPALQQEIRERLQKLLSLLPGGNTRRLEQHFRELQERLDETVLARTVLRSLAHRFVQAWQQAGQAAKAFDSAALGKHLEAALRHWQEACERAEELHDELGRRREACDLWLRWIASGQISAFALTEPSAGSDTARVATRAKLRSVPVEQEADGTFRFVPADGKEPRFLLDARRLEFRPDGAFYRWDENAEPARIRFDEYDYETDDPAQSRYYEAAGRRVQFTDVAQLRTRDGRPWYDYWELTGAKMWITNGRVAGVFCLYAKTEEGVTGFVVDRHAEGLVVGKDEAKMGQLGSPTNELALQAVRVPRENVLGLEGRGQVNALETLNVGRAGIAMSAMAQMAGLIERSREFAQANYSAIPDWVAWRLQRMEEARFSAEAVAHEVVGRFDHPQSKSVRMESAISKMLVSELLHHIIELAEDIHGLAGQTQLHLVEKRKRDARILNIYEGTNEILRFLILKELAGDLAPRWSQAAGVSLPGYLGPEALELEALKGEVRQRVSAALDVFGQDLWQNPNLQANCFLLAEAVAWLKAADSTLARLAWLDHPAQADEDAGLSPKVEVARRSAARCGMEVRHRLHRFDEELAHLRRGYYAPEIRAASLLFDRSAAAPARRLVSQITRPLSVLVIVEPTAANVPQPAVAGGRLLEPHWTLSDADRAALETALRFRDQSVAPVRIQVFAAGPKGHAQVLREALSLGVDRARLVVSEFEGLTSDSAASALAAVLGEGSGFDLVLGGSADANTEEGVVARLTAEALGVAYAGRAAQVVVRKTDVEADVLLIDGAGGQQRVRPLAAAVSVESGLPLRPFSVAGYLTGLAKVVELERWPKRITARSIAFEPGTQAASAADTEEPSQPLTPEGAARRALSRLGLEVGSVAPLQPFEGVLDDVSQPTVLDSGVVAVLAADVDGRLPATAATVLHAAGLVAEAEAVAVSVLLLVPSVEVGQRRAAAQVLELTRGNVVLLQAEATAEVNSRLFQECWPGLSITPRAVVGEPWTEDAFAALSRQAGTDPVTAFRIRRLTLEEGRVVVESCRAHGRLRVRRTVAWPSDSTCWVALAPEAEVTGKPALAPVVHHTLQRWAPRLKRFYGRDEIHRLLEELKQESGLVNLADADFIIDVGYGVGNRDGYEAVIEPLEQALRDLGVRNLVVGGSRKVTEELHLLAADRQIGQSGVSVNPQLLLAIGISGAPQHLNYIGGRALVLAFNRDPEAPLMTLNQRQPRPRVFPVVGDLFETVPAFITALRRERRVETAPRQLTAEVGMA
jgi:electron transfer flavoprotein-quinone oxidoreductase